MRITDSMMVGNMLENLTNNKERLNTLNEQLSSGKKFSKPSDDPIKVTTSMSFSNQINNYEQYQKDINNAKSWLETTENTLGDSTEVMQRANELALYGANDSLNEEDRKNMAEEVKQLRDELISIANSKLGSDYLFSGQATGEKPISLNPDYDYSDPVEDHYVEYNGDKNKIKRKISDDNKLTVNLNAEDVFKENIETLNKLYEDLKNGEDGEKIASYVKDIQDGMDKSFGYRAEIGAKINRMDLIENRIDDDIFNIKKLNSKNEDVDLAEVVTDLKMSENVYRASLSSAGRIIQPSLVDFIK
ncbi:MAG: flagellar hook-associated protein FlgL [Halanaerobiales bacterium]|nr:flagellar hook-associated protein FlgL [Halanaerobiales bacterium]